MGLKGVYVLIVLLVVFSLLCNFVIAESCLEGDGGDNYDERAVCTDGTGGYPDICLGEFTLKESYCDDYTNNVTNETDERCEYDTYRCPNGCLDGACLEFPIADQVVNNTIVLNDTEDLEVNDTSNETDDVNQTVGGAFEEELQKKGWFGRLIDWFRNLF